MSAKIRRQNAIASSSLTPGGSSGVPSSPARRHVASSVSTMNVLIVSS
jgi:hypothetical protein